MSPLACRKDMKTLGKVSILDTQEMPVKQDVELKSLESNLDASLDKQKTIDISPTVDKSAVVNVTVESQVFLSVCEKSNPNMIVNRILVILRYSLYSIDEILYY